MEKSLSLHHIPQNLLKPSTAMSDVELIMDLVLVIIKYCN